MCAPYEGRAPLLQVCVSSGLVRHAWNRDNLARCEPWMDYQAGAAMVGVG